MASVLIVDDSALMRKVLKKIFSEKTNLEVVGEAKNGLEAFVMYKRLKPDLVTMDMIMPVLDGIGSLKKIIKGYPTAKIVMISAINKKNMVISAIQSGAVNFILKPISTKKILDMVREVFGESSIILNKNKSKQHDVTAETSGTNGKIILYLDDKKNNYDNYRSWINNIEDEMHKELVRLWKDKVIAETMTKEEFNKKIQDIV